VFLIGASGASLFGHVATFLFCLPHPVRPKSRLGEGMRSSVACGWYQPQPDPVSD